MQGHDPDCEVAFGACTCRLYRGASNPTEVIGLDQFIPTTDPTTASIETRNDELTKLRAQLEKIEATRVQENLAREQLKRDNEQLAQERNDALSEAAQLETKLSLLTSHNSPHMRRVLDEASKKLSAPLREEVTRLRASIVEIARERDLAQLDYKSGRMQIDEMRDALVELTLKMLKLERNQALGWERHAEKDRAYMDALRDRDGFKRELAAAVDHAEQLIKERHDFREQLRVADADRVPLRMDLDEAKATIARMQPLCDAAQRWATGAIGEHLIAAIETYEAACTQAANAEQNAAEISTDPEDLPF